MKLKTNSWHTDKSETLKIFFRILRIDYEDKPNDNIIDNVFADRIQVSKDPRYIDMKTNDYDYEEFKELTKPLCAEEKEKLCEILKEHDIVMSSLGK